MRPLRLLAAASLLLATLGAAAARAETEVATFGGGCFWCVESDFDKVPGVLKTISGYMGGDTKNPTYEQVSSGRSGHIEVVQVTFDPAKISYEKLLHVFWRTIDPVDAGGQFCDRGSQYRTAVFTHSDEQARLAQASKSAIDASKKLPKPIATEILAAGAFTAAEDYHQDFYKKSPFRYTTYRAGCGRDARVKELWGAEAGGGIAQTH